MSPAPSALWRVELDLFQGPLRTLLELIERRELPVARVSLVAVADQYLALIRSSPALDLDLTAEFLHVAARLLLLKSLAVLPHPDEGGPSAGDDEDEGEDLEARLLLYRRFRDGARLLAARREEGLRTFGRPPPGMPAVSAVSAVSAMPTDAPAGTTEMAALSPASLDPRRLRRAASRALERERDRARAEAAAPRPLVPFAQVLQAVVARLRGREQTTFHDVAAEAADAVTAITMFLAILELVRRQRLLMSQQGRFGPIILEPAVDVGVGWPGADPGGRAEG